MKRAKLAFRAILGLCALAFVLASCANPSQTANSSSSKNTVSLKVALGSGPSRSSKAFSIYSSSNYVFVQVLSQDGATVASTPLTLNSEGYWSGELSLPDTDTYYVFEAYVYTAKSGGDLMCSGAKTVEVTGDLMGTSAVTIGVAQISLAGGSMVGAVPGTYPTTVAFYDDGSSRFNCITTDGRYIYGGTLDGTILQIDMLTGASSTILSGFDSVMGIVYGNGALYASVFGSAGHGAVYKCTEGASSWSSTALGTGPSITLGQVVQKITYLNGYVYVADHGNNEIVRIDPNSAEDTTEQSLSGPLGLTTDGGSIYATTAVISDGVHTGGVWESSGSAAYTEMLGPLSNSWPSSLATDGTSYYYFDGDASCLISWNSDNGSHTLVSGSPISFCSDGINLFYADGDNAGRIYRLIPAVLH
jgi:hypothetical protein